MYDKENPRFYGMDLDELDGHAFPFGPDTHGIVDEEQGGIIAYCHSSNTMLLVNALNSTVPGPHLVIHSRHEHVGPYCMG